MRVLYKLTSATTQLAATKTTAYDVFKQQYTEEAMGFAGALGASAHLNHYFYLKSETIIYL